MSLCPCPLELAAVWGEKRLPLLLFLLLPLLLLPFLLLLFLLLLLLLPRAPAKIPPPLPLPPPREAPPPPGPALPFQPWTARRGARGAGGRVAARRCPLRGPPRPLAVGWLQKSCEQRWRRRRHAGERTRVGNPRREWAAPRDGRERPSSCRESTPVPASQPQEQQPGVHGR